MVGRIEVRTESGTVGYRRRVSLITALRIGSASISVLDGATGVDSGGRFVRISSRSAVCHFGFTARR